MPPLAPSPTQDDLGFIAGTGASRLGTFLRTHWTYVLSVIVLFLVLNALLSPLVTSSNRLILAYVGAPGSSNYRIRDRLAQAIKGITSIPGVRYSAAVVPTSGIFEVENKLTDDVDGRSIGVI